jgi:hypothetical protein
MNINELRPLKSFKTFGACVSKDIFCNFYLVKNNKISINATTTKAKEKIRKN